MFCFYFFFKMFFLFIGYVLKFKAIFFDNDFFYYTIK